MLVKQAKILLIENSFDYSAHIITQEKVQLKAENFREKNLKKAYRIQCFPPLAGLYVKDKNLYKICSVNWYERFVMADKKLVSRGRATNIFKVIPPVTSSCNKILFCWDKKNNPQEREVYFQLLPGLQFSTQAVNPRVRRGVHDELESMPDSRAVKWKKFLQQHYGPLVEGLEEPYLRYLPLHTLVNLQGALLLAQLKPLEPAPNPLAQLLPFLKPEDYKWWGEFTNFLAFLKLFEGYIAAGKEKEFLSALKEQAGHKYWEHRYEEQNGLYGALNGPIEALASIYRLLGFILYNTPRQDYKLAFSLILKTYLEGAGWTTGLELEKFRLSNFAGVRVKVNSSCSRLQLEQQAVLLGIALPLLVRGSPALISKARNVRS